MPETKAPQPNGNGEAEPAAAFPFCSAERQLASAGIVASMSTRQGEFRRPLPAGRSEALREPAALRQGTLVTFSSPRKPIDTRGETRPITANRKHLKPKGDQPWTRPALGRRIVTDRLARDEGARSPAGNGEAGPAVVFLLKR
ncbi:MAG: hypothetical protein R3E45_02295 [Rhodocyclaceae bacterium]